MQNLADVPLCVPCREPLLSASAVSRPRMLTNTANRGLQLREPVAQVRQHHAYQRLMLLNAAHHFPEYFPLVGP
jgi:hypothetical protein